MLFYSSGQWNLIARKIKLKVKSHKDWTPSKLVLVTCYSNDMCHYVQILLLHMHEFAVSKSNQISIFICSHTQIKTVVQLVEYSLFMPFLTSCNAIANAPRMHLILNGECIFVWCIRVISITNTHIRNSRIWIYWR